MNNISLLESLNLAHRKNDFQHGGKRPVSMSQYLAKMVEVAKERKINIPPDPQA